MSTTLFQNIKIACPVLRIGEELREVLDDDEGPFEVRQEKEDHAHSSQIGTSFAAALRSDLKDAKAPESVIEKAENLKLPICER